MGGVLGTGIAAGVAQTAHQAQQLGRQRDKQMRDAKRLAQHQLEVQRIRVEGLEEDDAAEDATRIRIDNQVPEHEHHELPERRRQQRSGDPPTSPEPRDVAELAQTLGPLPLPVDATGLTRRTRAAAPDPPTRAAAAYQHTQPHHTANPPHRLDLEG